MLNHLNASKPASIQHLVLKLRTIQTISSRLRTLENNIESSDSHLSESLKPNDGAVQDLFRILSDLLDAINSAEIQINQLETRLSSIEEINRS